MVNAAGQAGPSLAPFLLIWGLLALMGGGALVTSKVSARFRAIIIDGLAARPGRQARARSMPLVFVRAIGGVFVVCGLIAIPLSITLMARS
ncbi:hypothetical protein DMH02_004425 [Streptomyces sp. WAC 00631]|uniref:hypothetical protein n=1 Tax=Streptomyces sp. WAC 00631 TaxID=2203201 RepID=UPI000F76995A|nr:hypothetical protein [Streptomyces sp. WAC 00631]MCC5032516.1 hypothetical protein [Streptomyces sp. WAC 00631]